MGNVVRELVDLSTIAVVARGNEAGEGATCGD